MIFADAPAGQQHLLARREAGIVTVMNRTGKVDTRHHREVADNFPFTGDGERIFIVQAGPLDVDGDVALRQQTVINGLHCGEGFAILLF